MEIKKMNKNIKLIIDSKLVNKLNSITKYLECNRKDLMEFLIVEAWKSIDREKKLSRETKTRNILTFETVSFVTENIDYE
jgi:hypothetical protein